MLKNCTKALKQIFHDSQKLSSPVPEFFRRLAAFDLYDTLVAIAVANGCCKCLSLHNLIIIVENDGF